MPNLKITHAVVGPFRGGVVVPTSAIEGGLPECERLVSLGACAWTEELPTEEFPAAASAVAEMTDDELAKENAKLNAELEKAKAEQEKVAAEVFAKAKADADAEVAALKAELEKLKADADKTGKGKK